VGIGIFPWPSDHRAVVSTFRVVPAPAPAMISVTPRRVTQGDAFILRSYDPSRDKWTGLIVPRGAAPKAAITGVRDLVNGYQRTIRLSSQGMAPGNYDAILVGADGKVLKRHAFTVAAHGSEPELIAVDPSVRPGSPIRVKWNNSPGDLRDWIGLYAAGETDVMRYRGFVYTEAMFDGQAALTPDAPETAPAGDYELRLMHDETYVVLARTKVTVTP
jgi:hypothetical protein